MPASRFVAADPHVLPLQDAPIQPQWIIAGEPHARSTEIARSADGASNVMIWECTAGEFHWFFGVDETVHIIEGEVLVRDEHGKSSLLRAGDVAFFPAGTWMIWRVGSFVRKIAFLRHPLPQPFGALLRLFNHGLNIFRLRMKRQVALPSAPN